MKKLIILFLLFLNITAFSQTTPPIKTLADGSYQQQIHYLLALKRLGIPTSPTDNLNAVETGANSIKLLYNTTLEKLRIYNPSTGLWSDVAGSVGGRFTDILYSDLVNLINTNALIKGSMYRITDYVTTHNIPNVSPTVVNTGSVEPLIVTALSSNSLSEIAYSEQYPKDIIYYEVSNTGISGATKGVIIKRTDTNFDVTFPNDFRNVKYRRWKLNPPAWNNGGNSINALALVNNAIYICTQTHATSQNPEVANSAYWTQIIQNNTNYLSALSTGYSYARSTGAGGTITIPVNTSDFVDVLAIPNYSSNTGSISVLSFPGTKVLNNTVIYTDNQSFAFVRNILTGGINSTFNLLGTFYCYENNFGYLSNSIIQGNNTGTASVNLAISFNNFKLTLNTTMIGQLIAYNTVNAVVNSYLGKIFYKVNGDRIENCNFPNFVGNVHFTSTLSSIRATSEKSIQDVTFLTTVGNEYNTDNSTSGGLYRPVTLPGPITRKTFIGKYLDDTNTPNAFTSTDRVVYIDPLPSSGSGTITSVTSSNSNIGVANNTTAPMLTLASTISSNTSGNAATATQLANSRTIGTTGVVSTPASFDGSSNVNIDVTALPATLITGTLSAANGGAGTNNGILKANGAGIVTVATPGTDYLTNLPNAQQVFTQGNTTTTGASFGGNVGIGIPNPTEKLEVSGNIKLTGNLKTTAGDVEAVGGYFNSLEVATDLTVNDGLYVGGNIYGDDAIFNSASINGEVHVAGHILATGLKLNNITITSNYTLTQDDYTVRVNTAAGNVTVTLPIASANVRAIYIIKKVDSTANIVTIDGDGSFIDGTPTKTLTTQWKTITVQSNGAHWDVLSN